MVGIGAAADGDGLTLFAGVLLIYFQKGLNKGALCGDMMGLAQRTGGIQGQTEIFGILADDVGQILIGGAEAGAAVGGAFQRSEGIMEDIEGVGQLAGDLVAHGDAGSFANPVESWGANVAQWQGRMFAQLVAGMKRDNDFSEARFAEYEEKWANDWVGDDLHLVPLNNMFRNGKFDAAMKAVDAMIVRAVAGKIDCESYSQLMPAGVAEMLPHMIDLLPMPPLRDFVKNTYKQAAPLLEMAAKLKD